MGKKQEVKPLPPTKAETAEKRLEELISHDSIETILQNPQNDYHSIKGGKLRLYPDGYEAVLKNRSDGLLYLKNVNVLVWYDIKKEREQSTIPAEGEK